MQSNRNTFKVGQKRPPNSGRAKGTPNKRTQSVIELVEKSGKCPFKVMLDLLDHADAQIRLSAAKELAGYIAPKRKAIEVSGQLDTSDQSGKGREAAQEYREACDAHYREAKS